MNIFHLNLNIIELLILGTKYYTNFFLQANNDIKRTWRGIKQIINLRGTTSHNIPQKIEIDGLMLNDKQNIANAFNDYFTSIGPDLASKVPESNTSFDKFMNSRLKNSFVLFPVTAGEIECEIQNLNASKSTGPFSIPCKLLIKSFKHVLSGPLAFLFNYSFSTGIVPNQFKMARVIPIYKKGE